MVDQRTVFEFARSVDRPIPKDLGHPVGDVNRLPNARDALIEITGDCRPGPYFQTKASLLEGGIRVPLIVKPPGAQQREPSTPSHTSPICTPRSPTTPEPI